MGLFLLNNELDECQVQVINQINQVTNEIQTKFSAVIIGEGIEDRRAFGIEMLAHLIAKRSLCLVAGMATCWNENNRLSTFILARSIFENTAVAHEAHRKISNYINNKSYDEIEKLVLTLTRGTRIKEWDFLEKNTNVLTLIDSTDKKFPGFKKMYDLLSEHAHPNASGLDYGRIEFDIENGTAHIHNPHTITSEDYMELKIIKDTLMILSSELTALNDISRNFNSEL